MSIPEQILSRNTLAQDKIIGAYPHHEKEIKRRIRMGWSAFGRQHNVMIINLTITEE